MSENLFDVVVIGAGPVGENLAQYAHEGGLSVAIIEEELLGGECSYYACMPSKALIRPLQVLHAAEHLPGLRGTTLDPKELLARRDSWVSHYQDSGQYRWAQDAGLAVFRGHGHIVAPRVVEVSTPEGNQQLEARRAVVIASGSSAKIPGTLQGLLPWDNRDATGVREVPKSIAIVGGGVVAVEAATWLSALGSQVTLLVRGNHLLGELGAQVAGVSDLVQRGLEAVGVHVLLGTSIESASRESAQATGLGQIHGGAVSLQLSTGKALVTSEILVATGRVPNLAAVGLESIGLSTADALAENLPQWLYVLGDAGGKTALTHQGKYEARVLGSHLAGKQEYFVQEVPVPQVIFTNPQVAHVGLSAHQAEQLGLRVVTARADMSEVAGALLLSDDTSGFGELVVDLDSGRLLGATFVGEDAADLLQAATVAVLAKLSVKVLRHAVPAYPTSSEIWLRMLEKLPQELR